MLHLKRRTGRQERESEPVPKLSKLECLLLIAKELWCVFTAHHGYVADRMTMSGWKSRRRSRTLGYTTCMSLKGNGADWHNTPGCKRRRRSRAAIRRDQFLRHFAVTGNIAGPVARLKFRDARSITGWNQMKIFAAYTTTSYRMRTTR